MLGVKWIEHISNNSVEVDPLTVWLLNLNQLKANAEQLYSSKMISILES